MLSETVIMEDTGRMDVNNKIYISEALRKVLKGTTNFKITAILVNDKVIMKLEPLPEGSK